MTLRAAVALTLLFLTGPAFAQSQQDQTTNRLQGNQNAAPTTNTLQNPKAREPTTTGLGTPNSKDTTTKTDLQQGNSGKTPARK